MNHSARRVAKTFAVTRRVTDRRTKTMLCVHEGGLVYALWLVIGVLLVVILFQQRKLGNVRDENDSLHRDARALILGRGEDATAAVDVHRELRQLRAENEQLRRELQQLRGGSEAPRRRD